MKCNKCKTIVRGRPHPAKMCKTCRTENPAAAKRAMTRAAKKAAAPVQQPAQE